MSARDTRIRRHRYRLWGFDLNIFSSLYETRFRHHTFFIITSTSSTSEESSSTKNFSLADIMVKYLILQVIVLAELFRHFEE